MYMYRHKNLHDTKLEEILPNRFKEKNYPNLLSKLVS